MYQLEKNKTTQFEFNKITLRYSDIIFKYKYSSKCINFIYT